MLPKNSFAKNVGILVGGSAVAQFLLIAISPLLTRLYSPEQFGLLAVYASLLALLVVVCSFRYELAIPVPESKCEASSIVLLCLILVCATSVFVAIVCYYFGDGLIIILNSSGLAGYLWLLPIGVFLCGVYNVFSYWAVRTKGFNVIAWTRMKQAVVTIVVQLVGFKLGGLALILGQLAGQSTGVWGLALFSLKQPAFKEVRLSSIGKVTYKYRHFPMFSTFGGLLNALGAQLPILLFSSFFSPIVAGLYLLSNRIIFTPSKIVQDAIAKVLFSTKNDLNSEAEYTKLIGEAHKILLLISSPVAALIFLFSPVFFSFVFGDEWVVAGDFARYLSIVLIFQFASSPLTVVFHSLHRPDLTLIYNLALFILRVVGVLLGYYYESSLVSVVGFSLLSSVGYLLFALGTTQLAGVSKKIFIYNNLLGLLSGLVVVAVPALIIIIKDDYFIVSFGVGLSILILYYSRVYKLFSEVKKHG